MGVLLAVVSTMPVDCSGAGEGLCVLMEVEVCEVMNGRCSTELVLTSN